jgi:hypothetical protein
MTSGAVAKQLRLSRARSGAVCDGCDHHAVAEDRSIDALAYAEVAGWFIGRAGPSELAALRAAY